MERRSFLKLFGLAAASVVVAPKALPALPVIPVPPAPLMKASTILLISQEMVEDFGPLGYTIQQQLAMAAEDRQALAFFLQRTGQA